ncbi:hypothetical protein [Clostridium sp. DJ247]|uniref:hypothetical protein n=1 Tax=Clostridium sp. DJ247 TaxID=2726188 RepID=UPI00162456DB|nr:hypothetical protein [Clostridium sp. DJ247]MBC2581295.1 hypothetical protein [Clostridium sp. DJ247]
MGKIIEFKKFSKKVNRDNLNIKDTNLDMFSENDLLYEKRELNINLKEIDLLLKCVHKQIQINNKLINSENHYNYEKIIYLKDFNDKLHDIMYFLTNSVYKDPIVIKLNFFQLKYLLGTLQLELEILGESNTNTDNTTQLENFNIIKNVYDRLYPIYDCLQRDML